MNHPVYMWRGTTESNEWQRKVRQKRERGNVGNKERQEGRVKGEKKRINSKVKPFPVLSKKECREVEV
jgi:hypothetical protein